MPVSFNLHEISQGIPILKSEEPLLQRNLLKVVHLVMELNLIYVFLGFQTFEWSVILQKEVPYGRKSGLCTKWYH